MSDEVDYYSLSIDGEYVEFSTEVMRLVEVAEKIVASYCGRPLPRVEISDSDDHIILRMACEHEECESDNWRWKEGLKLVVNNK